MPQQSQIITFPTPLYNNNLPIQSNFYQPGQFVISDVTLGLTTIVQTSVNHNYVIGQLIRLLIPQGYGCVQLSERTGYVLTIPSTNEVEVSIDSSVNVNQFLAAQERNSPQILAIGDVNSGIQSSTGAVIPSTNIPGAFINIS